MRQIGVRVMKIRDHNEPVTDTEPWNTVQLEHSGSAVHGGGVANERSDSEQTGGGEMDLHALSRSKQNRSRIKMISPLRIRLLARDVEDCLR
jgi:hypothetical protein